MPCPSLIMGLIAKTRLKFPSGLTLVQRDYPIGSQTVTRSTAHIRGSRIDVSSIPWNPVKEKGGDAKEEIDRFIAAPETSALLSSSAPARAPARGPDVYHAWLPCAAYHRPVCIRSGSNHNIIFSDRGLICRPWFRFKVWPVIASLAIRVEKGEKV